MVEMLVVPSLVQGEGAEDALCAGMELAAHIPNLDLLILGRGGGSAEDLWAFNSERVARALAAMPVPTISAVGHETDISLTDLVADIRAPTPSVAAETALPDLTEVGNLVATMAQRLASGLSSHTTLGRERLERTADRLTGAISNLVEQRRTLLLRLGAQLDALSPLKVLERGYAVARDDSGRVLKQTRDFAPGMEFGLTVFDGEVTARAVDQKPGADQ
jgi:exodeoxyribonuclease VII large subunit